MVLENIHDPHLLALTFLWAMLSHKGLIQELCHCAPNTPCSSFSFVTSGENKYKYLISLVIHPREAEATQQSTSSGADRVTMGSLLGVL